jgi:FkbM family methyltransferase
MQSKLYNGLICNLHNTNDFISRLIKQSGVWEPNVSYWIEHLSRGGIFLDVGSNIGYCSLVASKKYAKIYSFEPIPENYILLERSLQDNNIQNVEIIKKCVGNSESLELTAFADNMGGTRNIQNTQKQNVSHMKVQSSRVYEVVTLDSFTENIESIDLMKVDVEGHELQVLQGFSKNITKCKNILLELSPCSLPVETCIEILNVLKTAGYTIYDIGCCEHGTAIKSVGCTEIAEFRSFVERIQQTNILATQTPAQEQYVF